MSATIYEHAPLSVQALQGPEKVGPCLEFYTGASVARLTRNEALELVDKINKWAIVEDTDATDSGLNGGRS